MKKKIIGFLLTIAMIFSMSPLNLLAADALTGTENGTKGYVENIQLRVNLTNPSVQENLTLSPEFNSKTKEYDVQVANNREAYLSTSTGKIEISVTLSEDVKDTCTAYCVYQDQYNNVEKKLTLQEGFNSLENAYYSSGKLTTMKVRVVSKPSEGESNSEETTLDEYTINVNYLATLSGLTVKTGNDTRPLNQTIDATNFSYSVDIPDTFTSVAISGKTGLTGGAISINENVSANLNVDIKWDNEGRMQIPIVVSKEGYISGSYTLTLVKSNTDYMPRITTNLDTKKVTYTQGEEITPLEITVTTVGNGTLTYQWYSGMAKKAQNTLIKDATGASYTPSSKNPTSTNGTFYKCKVNYAVDGKTYTIYSDVANIQVKALVAATPKFTTDLSDEVSVSQGKDEVLSVVATRTDSGVLTYQWYQKKNADGTGSAIEGATSSEYQVDTSQPGEAYYYCIVTNTIQGKTKTATSKTSKVVVNTVSSVFNKGGDGSESNPYIIEDGSDLTKMQELVNDGNSLNQVYFKFKNNITLPANWIPIGCLKDKESKKGIDEGKNLWAFSGNIDGDGKTLTVPEGEMPLLGYVKGASVKNLNIYGTKINGYGLVNNFEGVGLSGTAITIDNVTLKKGTKTLKSGLLGAEITTNGYAGVSAGFVAVIKNCTIEDGVEIGYDGKQSLIGSFAGRMQGTIENCTSAATVKGTSYVGGIIGTRDNAMGNCIVKNCTFSGNVEASGDNAGGIAGGGYVNNSAPNGIKISILACKVTGNVKGVNNVGGILGGDNYVAQAWNAYSFLANTFSGKVYGEKNVGAIIGYYKSLNNLDNIAANLYTKDCGAKNGIGTVEYVDTNYNNPTSVSGTTYFSTEKGVADCPTVKWCDWKTNYNRTDDPLGKDKEKLTEAVDEIPDTAFCYELTINGTPEAEYYIGDDLDFSNVTFTAKWTDGTETQPAFGTSDNNVKASGYNKSSNSVQTITLSYGYAQTSIQVAVLKKASGDTKKDTLTVSFKLLGDSKHDSDSDKKVHGLANGGLTTWTSGTYEVPLNSTVWNLMQKVQEKDSKVTFNAKGTKYGTYVYSVTYNGTEHGEFDNGKKSGWMYTVNGTHPEVSVGSKFLNNGDTVVFHYTDDYTVEEGSDKWTSGSTTETVTTVTTDTKKDTTTTPTEVKVTEKTTTDGTKEKTAKVTVTAGNQTEIIKQATEKKSEEIVLEAAAADTKSAQTIQVELNVTFVKNVSEKTNADLSVNTENGKVTLDQETIKTVLSEAKGTTITIEVAKVEKPTEVQKEAAGTSAEIINITVKSGNTTIHDFKSGKARIKIEIPANLKGKKVAAVYIDDNGKVEQMPGKSLTENSKKYYEFTTSHFSTFALVDADELGLDVADELDVKAEVAKLTPVARSAKTAKKSIKVTTSLDKNDKAIIAELKDAGYTVKYRFYRSTKKAASYKSALTKKTSSYVNTSGKAGTRYYYKVQVRVYDKDGKLVAKTALKQCKYATRIFG